ncbi:ATP-binding cassette domain-containing protein, partial [Mediterraneibacter glycyrrhizinilyticus]
MYLEVENVCKKIKEDYVLKNVTLSMEKGRVYGIQGKNGCGKSMLMRVMCGLVLPSAGRVVISGEELGK